MAEVFVVGGGGRERAIEQAMLDSPEVDRVVVSSDVQAGRAEFSGSRIKPFVIIGPEAPLVDGQADYLRDEGYVVFGASKAAAKYEARKSHGIRVMRSAGVPHPHTFIADTTKKALSFVEGFEPDEYAIKADGLAEGKGVFLEDTREDARHTTLRLREGTLADGAGTEIINYQDREEGAEVTAMVVCGADKDDEIVILPLSQDHKRLGEGDTGPNTGGMGAYTPVPRSIISPLEYEQIRDIVVRSRAGMRAEGVPYEAAVLYVGLIKTKNGLKVLEYNVRFGDPEAQVVLPAAQFAGVDMYRLLRSAAECDLEKPAVDFADVAIGALAVCMAAYGYPNKPRLWDRIWGLDKKYPGVTLQLAGVKYDGDVALTAGGRVGYVTGVGQDVDEATRLAYNAIDLDRIGPESGKIGFSGMQVRRDIGWQARRK